MVPALNILATILADSSYALLTGALLAHRWLRDLEATAEQERLRRLALWLVTVMVVCHLTHPWFVASSMSGSTQFREVLALIPTILSATRQGWIWYTNSIAIAVLVALQFWSRGHHSSSRTWINIAALLVLAATKSASAHASEEGDFRWPEIAEFLHLLGTAIWAGAIVISGFLVVPHIAGQLGAKTLWIYGARLSRTVTWAVAILVLSGVYTAWRDMHQTPHLLWTSGWGQILLFKTSFVALALLLGAATRFRCLGRPAETLSAALMTKLMRSEAAVMIAILCISGLLANSSPSS